MELIKRELFGKTSLVNHLVPDAEIFDIDLGAITTDLVGDLTHTVNNSVFSWTKGNKVTIWTSGSEKMSWTDLLYRLNINVKVGAKTMKRIARAFSPRDVVVKMVSSDINIEMVAGDEFTRYNFESADDKDALLDGMASISGRFARKLMRRAGKDVSLLRHAEALSFTMISEDGFLKALLYIVEDQDADIVTSDANIKAELSTNNDVAWVMFDIFMPFGDPKTNIQLDIMMRDFLVEPEMEVKYLRDTLLKDYHNIVNGDAVKSLTEWTMPQLEAKVEGSNKVNTDFAALPDMASDMMARGLDYRWFPGLLDMLAAAGSNQWYNAKGKWVKYPLPCSWARPVISESGACLIGEEVDVERGEIRAIREGEVWVVNDLDYIEFFRTNAGGADLDDHFILMFRTIKGVRSVIVGRIPMGWREFSVFTFVDGDPFPSYNTVNGNIKEFPVITKDIPKTLYECLRDGDMEIAGVGELAPLTYPERYSPEVVMNIVNELISGETGNVGSIINAIMVAAATNPELLRVLRASMETIIDTFTQGGGAEARKDLMAYGQKLLMDVDVAGTTLDYVVTRRMGNHKIKRAAVVQGFFTQREAANRQLRGNFTKSIKNFAQEYNRNGNPLVVKLLGMFGLSYNQVAQTANPLFVAVRNAQKAFNYNIWTTMQSNQELDLEDGITAEQWNILYNQHLNTLRTIAGNDDPRKLEMVVLANWLVCMTIRNNSGRMSDRSVMNSVIWPIFVQALVHFGMGMNLEKLIAGGNAWITNWNVTCVCCGKTGNIGSVSNYARFVADNRHCNNCK